MNCVNCMALIATGFTAVDPDRGSEAVTIYEGKACCPIHFCQAFWGPYFNKRYLSQLNAVGIR